MNYVFFGNNVPLAERLRKALGTGVIECITLLQMKNTLLPAEEMDYCVFIEKTDPTLNIPAIMHLHKTFQNIYRINRPGNDPGGENILFASRNGLCHLRVYL